MTGVQTCALPISTREQINEMLSVAVYMGGGPSLMYAGEVLRAYDEFKQA